MPFARRFLIAGPLAVAVALLAHAALFGHAHAIAGAWEPGLIGSVGLSLGILFAAAVGAAALTVRDDGRVRMNGSKGSPTSLAAIASLGLQLAAGAALALAAIEGGEGHGLWVLTSGAVLAVLPLGALVAAAALAALRCATRLGCFLATAAHTKFERVVRVALPLRRLAPAVVCVAPQRGRAPPR